MAESIIVGQDYTIWDVVSAVKFNLEFPVLSKKLAEVALSLEAPKKYAKSVKHRLMLENYTHTDVFFEVLEEWVDRKGNEANLGSLITALEKSDLTDISEAIRNTFSHGVSPARKKYLKPPQDLPEFLKTPKTENNTGLVVSTPDISVTCRKIAAYYHPCRVHDFQQYFELAHELKGDTGILHVVIATCIDELKLSLRCRRKVQRLVVVANGDVVAELEELFKMHPVLEGVAVFSYDHMELRDLTFACRPQSGNLMNGESKLTVPV